MRENVTLHPVTETELKDLLTALQRGEKKWDKVDLPPYHPIYGDTHRFHRS